MTHRTDISKDVLAMERPSEEDVQATAERTKAALDKLVSGKIKAAQPKNVPNAQGDVTYMRYTPQQGGVEKQKIIKMVRPFSPSSAVPALLRLTVLSHRWTSSKTPSSRPSSRAKRSPAVLPPLPLPFSALRRARSLRRTRRTG